MSQQCGGRVVDTFGQTSADVYGITVYQRGAPIRTLEYARDVGWVTSSGSALPNEPTPLEWLDPDEPEDAEPWFDHHAVERYLRQVFEIPWWEPPSAGAPASVVA